MAGKIRKKDARPISEMRNLGPACQADLHAAGIVSAQDLIDLGPEASFRMMLQARIDQGKSTKCCNAAYLYAIYGAIHDLDWREIPEHKKREFKKLTASMRESGFYRR